MITQHQELHNIPGLAAARLGDHGEVPSTRTTTLVLGTMFVPAMFALGYLLGTAHGTTGAASTAPRAPSDAHAALAAALPPDAYAGCTAYPDREASGHPTALTCSSPLPGIDQLLVTKWTDTAQMVRDFTTTYGRKPDGKCGSYTGSPASGVRSTYGGGAPLTCFVNTNGAAVVLWEYPAQAVQVIAVRADGNTSAAFAWWAQAVKTPLR
jgi:hypothetical protein